MPVACFYSATLAWNPTAVDTQAYRIARDDRRRSSRREGDIDLAWQRERNGLGQDGLRQRIQVDRAGSGSVGAMDDHGMIEQLAGQAGEFVRALADARDCRGSLRCRCDGQDLDLGIERGERRADLMGCVGDEALHHGHALRQPAHEVVDRVDEVADLERRVGLDRAQVVRTATGDLTLDARERLQCQCDGETRRQQCKSAHRRDDTERLEGQVPRQRVPGLRGLGDHDRRPPARCGIVDPPRQRGDAHPLSLIDAVIEHDTGAGLLGPRLGGQVLIAGDDDAARVDDLVEDEIVGGERRDCGNRGI